MRSRLAAAMLPFLAASLLAQAPIVTWSGETMRLRSATVAAGPSASWNVTLEMENDNNNASLPSSFRRWWHCEIGNLGLAGAVLNVSVTNAGYTDIILPVWAQSSNGVTFGPYARLPVSSTPVLQGGSTHNFTAVVPAGVPAIRLAKYFPYSVARKDAWLATLAGQPKVRSITTLGNSVQGRPIHKIEFTDGTVPDVGKARVWIHAGIHPAETTSYFTVEGFVSWLLSGDPFAEVLLDRALIELCPMVNPDGVFLGNYRVNANSINLENEWSAPYGSTVPEIVALRTTIEGYMGTVAVPGSNPIRVLLNLHSSHGFDYPFHYQHTSNPSWNPTTNNTGVIPVVNAVEGQWILRFKARSPLVNLGATQSSALTSRPYVESMCHDRWTAVNGWLNAPGLQQPVMAITFEGTYRRGPDTVTWNTEADYRTCGAQMGRALFDHLGLTLTASLVPYSAPCTVAVMTGTLTPQPDGSHAASLQVAGAVANALGVLVLGSAPVAVPLPPPWSACTLLCTPDVTVSFVASPAGTATFAFPVPAAAGLVAWLQAFTIDWTVPALPLDATNGVRIQNNY
ncbi:MAG: M14 family zinc carboxypeptidase [Planctomycetota bacterium]